MSIRTLVLGATLVAGCGGQLNASVKTPAVGELAARPGAWVAYNLGCKQGCREVHRGDVITAVDGRPISSGAEVDEIDLARGTPVRLDLFRPGTGETKQVELLARPHEYMSPLTHVPPLWTVGTAALDRAPAWARLKAFGHATPALRFYKMDSPREYVDGRDLYGRAALIVLWVPDRYIQQTRMAYNDMLPVWYAGLQGRFVELAASGVDTYLVFNGQVAEADRRSLRGFAVGDETYRESSVPIYANTSFTNNPNTRGLEHAAADFNEMVFNDGHIGPIILIVDARGIVRWHSRGFERDGDPHGTLQAAIEFSLHQLDDVPAAEVPAPVVPVSEPAPVVGESAAPSADAPVASESAVPAP